jgi:hypothetical protein
MYLGSSSRGPSASSQLLRSGPALPRAPPLATAACCRRAAAAVSGCARQSPARRLRRRGCAPTTAPAPRRAAIAAAAGTAAGAPVLGVGVPSAAADAAGRDGPTCVMLDPVVVLQQRSSALPSLPLSEGPRVSWAAAAARALRTAGGGRFWKVMR